MNLENALVQVVLDALIESVIVPAIRRVLPAGEIPAEVVEAILPEVRKALSGEEPSWFELKRLTLAVTDDAIRDLKGKNE